MVSHELRVMNSALPRNHRIGVVVPNNLKLLDGKQRISGPGLLHTPTGDLYWDKMMVPCRETPHELGTFVVVESVVHDTCPEKYDRGVLFVRCRPLRGCEVGPEIFDRGPVLASDTKFTLTQLARIVELDDRSVAPQVVMELGYMLRHSDPHDKLTALLTRSKFQGAWLRRRYTFDVSLTQEVPEAESKNVFFSRFVREGFEQSAGCISSVCNPAGGEPWIDWFEHCPVFCDAAMATRIQSLADRTQLRAG